MRLSELLDTSLVIFSQQGCTRSTQKNLGSDAILPSIIPNSLIHSMSAFTLPSVTDSKSGWGPVSLSAQFRDIPYAPYSKADKLGRIADWSAPEGTQGKDQRGGAADQRGNRPGFRNFRGVFVFFYYTFDSTTRLNSTTKAILPIRLLFQLT